jgi:Cdc6-like AAA superfamily ATPase
MWLWLYVQPLYFLAFSHEGYQGPPGTGKTTVITAVVQSKITEHPSNTIWIIAQSNVAVKNVAEKLADSGFLDFKLLVSKDFHFDW